MTRSRPFVGRPTFNTLCKINWDELNSKIRLSAYWKADKSRLKKVEDFNFKKETKPWICLKGSPPGARQASPGRVLNIPSHNLLASRRSTD